MIEHAIALQQAEAARIGVGEAARNRLGRVAQRAPQPLALAGQQGEAVAVMDLRAPVGRLLPIAFAIPVHRGERCDADPLDAAAKLNRHADVLDDALRGHPVHEPPGARGARRIEQRVDGQGAVRALLQPEMREAGKFLGPGEAGVDRQSAGGQAILVERAGGAEIGRPLEDEPIAVSLRIHHPEAGKAVGARGQVVGTAELAAGEGEVMRTTARDGRDRDRTVRTMPQRQWAYVWPAEQRRIGAEGYRIVGVVADGPGRGRRRRRRGIRLAREIDRVRLQPVPRKSRLARHGTRQSGGAE